MRGGAKGSRPGEITPGGLRGGSRVSSVAPTPEGARAAGIVMEKDEDLNNTLHDRRYP